MAADGALKRNAGILGRVRRRRFVVERSGPLDCPQRQRTVHRPAFQVHVAEFARQAGRDRALARSGRAVDGDDEFALGWIRHRGNVRFYTAHAWKTTGPWGGGTLIVWGRAPSTVEAEQRSESSFCGAPPPSMGGQALAVCDR